LGLLVLKVRFGAHGWLRELGSRNQNSLGANVRSASRFGQEHDVPEISELPVATHEHSREFGGSLYSIEPECQSLFSISEWAKAEPMNDSPVLID
jgi:hypothetical protein